MSAAVILASLTPQAILLFILQMLIVTVVVRCATVLQQWIYWRSFEVSTGLVALAHAIALFAFAAMTDFVEAGPDSSNGVALWLHSVAVLWPLQLLLLAVDLAIRARRARPKVS